LVGKYRKGGMPALTGFVEVAKVSDIDNGMMKKVIIGDRAILLAKVEGRLYATDALCPHLQADLSEGTLQGTVLTCPLHSSKFDIRDGHVIRWTDLSGTLLTYAAKARPPRPLPTYPVRTDEDRVLVAFG
jgi:3-phenylpropionate/trans-cinnamate dioxygenase ferredoxin subunit